MKPNGSWRPPGGVLSHLSCYILWEGKLKACDGAVGWLQSMSLQPETQFWWQRGVKTAKGALMILAIDATLGEGLVFQFLIIPSQSRSGESPSSFNRGHCASFKARALCSRKGHASSDKALMNCDASAVNRQLQNWSPRCRADG